jgi:hypothetical protein
MGNMFKIKYEQLHQIYNGDQCIMVLIKNVTITFKGNQVLKTQNYKIFIKVMDESI